jgi:predicted MFS family arabinose efflux permease
MGISLSIDSVAEKQEGFKTRELVILFVLALMQFTYIVDYILLMPLGPELMHNFRIDAQQFSFLISVYTLSAAFSGFVASFLIDKFERKKALLLFYLGFSTGPIITTFASSYEFLLLARIFSGAFGGVLTALVMTMLGDSIETAKIGRATSFVLSANAAGSILGVPAALFLVHNGSWKTPFYIILCVNIIILVTAFIILPASKKNVDGQTVQKTTHSKTLSTTIFNPNFLWPLTFMSLLTLAGGFTILPFLSTYVSKNYNFSAQDLSFLFFAGGLASFFTAPLTGTLSDKFGKQNVFLLLNFLSIIPIILLTVFPLINKSVVLAVSTMFFMFSTGRHVSGMALINSRFDPKIRGRFISLNSSIQLFSGSLGTLLTGYLIFEEQGIIFNFDLVGIIAICATIICIFTAFVLDE